MTDEKTTVGMIAEFAGPKALLDAAGRIRDAGYKKYDSHSPFPIHGMDEAMGLSPSPLGWFVGVAAFSGLGLALLLQWWTGAVAYKLVISGKPLFSYQAYAPVTFGVAVLFGALTAFFGALALMQLPRPHHPVFYSDRFEGFSDDKFFISIEATDAQFDVNRTAEFLESVGGSHVELLKEDKEDS